MKRLLTICAVATIILAAAGLAQADTIDVYPGDSIQAAVDSANPGDTIIVHAGTYNQSVVFGSEDSDITLKGKDGAILDGTSLTTVDGIKLLAGVSGVTIEGFEICNYTGLGTGQGNAIQAWNDGTSDITIENNVMHDNSWNAILVGNEGTGLHTGWVVEKNTIYGNRWYSLELTNAADSVIKENTVTGGFAGILVQVRNTNVNNVEVEENIVSGATYGIYVLSYGPGATADLSGVVLTENEVNDSEVYGIIVWGYGESTVVGLVGEENEVFESGSLDIFDVNGIDSIWKENECNTCWPPDICSD